MKIKHSKKKQFAKRVHVDMPFNVFEEMPNLEFILACIPALNPPSDKHFVFCDNIYTNYDEQNNKIGVYCTHDIDDMSCPMYGMELKTIQGKIYTSLFLQRVFGEICLDPKYKDNIEGALTDIFIYTFTTIRKNLDRCIDAMECLEAKESVLKEKDDIIAFLDKIIKASKEMCK